MKTDHGFLPIEQIKPGMRVLAWNEKTGELTYSLVQQTFVRTANEIYRVKYSDGSVIETTWSHPFYITGKGWVKGKDLRPGMKSPTAKAIAEHNQRMAVSGGYKLPVQMVSFQNDLTGKREARVLLSEDLPGVMTIETVEVLPGKEAVYNFSVEDAHSYFVGEDGVLVHNEIYDNSSDFAKHNVVYTSLGVEVYAVTLPNGKTVLRAIDRNAANPAARQGRDPGKNLPNSYYVHNVFQATDNSDTDFVVLSAVTGEREQMGNGTIVAGRFYVVRPEGIYDVSDVAMGNGQTLMEKTFFRPGNQTNRIWFEVQPMGSPWYTPQAGDPTQTQAISAPWLSSTELQNIVANSPDRNIATILQNRQRMELGLNTTGFARRDIINSQYIRFNTGKDWEYLQGDNVLWNRHISGQTPVYQPNNPIYAERYTKRSTNVDYGGRLMPDGFWTTNPLIPSNRQGVLNDY